MYWAGARIGAAFLGCLVLSGQPSQPEFEVAAIRRVAPDAGRHGGGAYGPQGVRLKASTVRALIINAYRVKRYQIAGPAEIDNQAYEVNARVPAGSRSNK